METQLPLPKKRTEPQVFGPYLLCPNGLMDQDATLYGGRLRPKRHCVRRRPRSPSAKKEAQPLPTFGPCLLWPNGWMDQDVTWYDGRPRPGQHCVRCGPSSTAKGHRPQVSACVCCGQTDGWIKMPLYTKVGLGSGRIVLHGDPAPPPKRGTDSQFSAHAYCGQAVAHPSYC